MFDRSPWNNPKVIPRRFSAPEARQKIAHSFSCGLAVPNVTSPGRGDRTLPRAKNVPPLPGLVRQPALTHSLRCGLLSVAAPRLVIAGSCERILANGFPEDIPATRHASGNLSTAEFVQFQRPIVTRKTTRLHFTIFRPTRSRPLQHQRRHQAAFRSVPQLQPALTCLHARLDDGQAQSRAARLA